MRAAFLRAPNRRYPVYWTARSTLGDAAKEIVDHRDARIVPVADADSFFTGIFERVQTLERTRRENPLSMDLLVDTTKRYLAKPEHRIQLDELVTSEVESLIEKTDGAAFAPQGTWSPEEFRSRVAAYEAAAEPAARIAGVMGRWGDGSELPLILDAVRAVFEKTTRIRNGLTIWLDIHSYPAVLIFTAYGIGLTRAGRWQTVHEFLSAQLSLNHDGTVDRIVDLLFLWDWEGCDKNAWQNLDGFERRKTPLSDHLRDVFANWGQSFTGLTADFDVLFERFEILASIASLESTSEEELSEALERPQPHGVVRMPVGRSGWHRQVCERLLAEILQQPLKGRLLEAGFANGGVRSFLPRQLQITGGLPSASTGSSSLSDRQRFGSSCPV